MTEPFPIKFREESSPIVETEPFQQQSPVRPETDCTSLPPLKAVSHFPVIANSHQRLGPVAGPKKIMVKSLNKQVRDNRFLNKYVREQQEKLEKLSMKNPETPERKPVFRSAKMMGQVARPKPVELRPQLKSMKEQYILREKSIEGYLSNNEVLDDYKMLSHLGKGSFSVVSLAVNKQTNRRCAIKTYSKIDQIENYKFDNIYREVSNLQVLSHQNIIGLFHVVKQRRKLLLVMEDGGKLSLAGLLRKNKTISEAQAKPIFKQVLEGIQYCHRKGICHRDLKLENILIDSAGHIKIIDFGFSAKCGQKLNSFCGTPPYMAPEIAAKVPHEGGPTDMWALGILLYLMLFGKFPFRATSEKELYRLIQQGKFQMGDGVSPEAKSTISKLLTCKVRDRATASQILISNWVQGKG